jgi:hypothetical protein
MHNQVARRFDVVLARALAVDITNISKNQNVPFFVDYAVSARTQSKTVCRRLSFANMYNPHVIGQRCCIALGALGSPAKIDRSKSSFFGGFFWWLPCTARGAVPREAAVHRGTVRCSVPQILLLLVNGSPDLRPCDHVPRRECCDAAFCCLARRCSAQRCG